MKTNHKEAIENLRKELNEIINAAYNLEYEMKDCREADEISNAITKLVDANQILGKIKQL